MTDWPTAAFGLGMLLNGVIVGIFWGARLQRTAIELAMKNRRKDR